MDRPMKLKFSKDQKADAAARLRAILGENPKVCFVCFKSGVSSREDWVLLTPNKSAGDVENITRLVAGLLDRQYSAERKTLCPWAFDSQGAIKTDLSTALGFPIFSQTV